MDKKTLRKIPVEEADDLVVRTARLAFRGCRYVVSATIKDGMLIMSFYDVTAIRCGGTKPVMRTFHTPDDYITQDLMSEKAHWLTGSFYMMDYTTRPYGWIWSENEGILSDFRSVDDLETVMEYFRDYMSADIGDEKKDVWLRIERCQSSIKERRLEERHNKELEYTDRLMATVKEAPKDFFDWVWSTGMEFSQYLIYKDVGKGKAECECLVCHQKGKVKRSEIWMRNNGKGTCPFCGAKVTFKAKGRMPYRINDVRYFDYVDPTDDGFIFRIFYAWRSTFRADGQLPAGIRQGITEVRRAFYTFQLNDLLVWIPSYEPFERGIYKQHGGDRWCPKSEHHPCWNNVLYPGNLPEAWAHTPMKYSALEIFSTNRPNVEMRNEDMIKFYCRYPKLEWLIKMGLYRLARDAPYCDINLNRKTIYDILELSKVNTRVLQAVDGGMNIWNLLCKIQDIGLYVTPESLMEYYMVFDDDERALLPENRHATIHQICKYIRREAKSYVPHEGCRYWSAPISTEERKIYNTALDWLDYIEWCKRLGYDICNRSIYMPKNFRAVHDRTLSEIKALEDKIRAEEKRKRDAAIKKRMKKVHEEMAEILEANKNMDAFHIRGKGLILIVPKDGEEIRQEGENLHDCLPTYVNKVATGQTEIFFIRKEDEPDKSYFAMEYRDGKVVQCRGMNNCGMTPEVEAFVRAFEQLMRERQVKLKVGA